jgi:RNA polymerase sigma-70 factor (ECF subfamily)
LHRRKNHLYPLVDVETTEIELVEENAVNMLATEDLMHMIESLSPGYKTVFNLYAIEGYSLFT